MYHLNLRLSIDDFFIWLSKFINSRLFDIFNFNSKWLPQNLKICTKSIAIAYLISKNSEKSFLCLINKLRINFIAGNKIGGFWIPNVLESFDIDFFQWMIKQCLGFEQNRKVSKYFRIKKLVSLLSGISF